MSRRGRSSTRGSHPPAMSPDRYSSSAPSEKYGFEFSWERPVSIPTSDLPRASVDYFAIKDRLHLSLEQIDLVRRTLDTVVERHPEIEDLNLRRTEGRQDLCDILNGEIGHINVDIKRILRSTAEKYDGVGWLLYQLALYCLKEKQKNPGKSFGDPSLLSEGPEGDTDLTDDGDDIEELNLDDNDYDMEQENGIYDEEGSDNYGDDEGDAITPAQMVDDSDLESELHHYNNTVEPTLHARRGNNRVNGRGHIGRPPAGAATQNRRAQRPNQVRNEELQYSEYTEDEEDDTDDDSEDFIPLPENWYQANSFNVLLMLSSFFFVTVAIIALSCIQYIHEKHGSAHLWETIFFRNVATVETTIRSLWETAKKATGTFGASSSTLPTEVFYQTDETVEPYGPM